MVETLYAMGQGGGETGQTNPITTVIFIVIIIAILYFLLFLPQRKQEQKRKKMIENLNKGDKVVTSGGIHGTISRIKEDTIVINIAQKTEIKMERNAVSKVTNKQ